MAILSLLVEFIGLFVLWIAKSPNAAAIATAVCGCGFALVFPALGVEVVREVDAQNRGAALGMYTSFLDLAMGLTGPLAGYVITRLGYADMFLFASGAAISGCLMLAVILCRMREHQARDVSKWVRASGT